MTERHVISADSHVQEPPDLYERLPRAMRDRAPRRVERDGKTYILIDGRKPRRIDLAETRATEDDQNREFRNETRMCDRCAEEKTSSVPAFRFDRGKCGLEGNSAGVRSECRHEEVTDSACMCKVVHNVACGLLVICK